METENYFISCRTATHLFTMYKQLACTFHPKRGGSLEKMKKVYTDYKKALKDPVVKFKDMEEDLQESLKNFPTLIKELLSLEVELEMCGSWLWVSGNTYAHKDKLKELGLRYSPNKQMWYFRPNSEASHSSSPMDMSWIRGKYGSDLKNPMPIYDEEDSLI